MTVYAALPPTSSDQTRTIAVHGAAASRTLPAMYWSASALGRTRE